MNVVAKPQLEKKSAVKQKQVLQRKQPTVESNSTNVPVFKIQIFAINRQLASDSELFKGHKNVSSETEGNLRKYMIGSSTNYNEILRLKESLKQDFPQAFIVAFKNGKRMNTGEAVKEFVKNKRK